MTVCGSHTSLDGNNSKNSIMENKNKNKNNDKDHHQLENDINSVDEDESINDINDDDDDDDCWSEHNDVNDTTDDDDDNNHDDSSFDASLNDSFASFGEEDLNDARDYVERALEITRETGNDNDDNDDDDEKVNDKNSKRYSRYKRYTYNDEDEEEGEGEESATPSSSRRDRPRNPPPRTLSISRMSVGGGSSHSNRRCPRRGLSASFSGLSCTSDLSSLADGQALTREQSKLHQLASKSNHSRSSFSGRRSCGRGGAHSRTMSIGGGNGSTHTHASSISGGASCCLMDGTTTTTTVTTTATGLSQLQIGDMVLLSNKELSTSSHLKRRMPRRSTRKELVETTMQ